MTKWFGESEGMPPPHVEVMVLTENTSTPQIAWWRENEHGVEWVSGRLTEINAPLSGRVRRWTYLDS
jgi:hypothetical protein